MGNTILRCLRCATINRIIILHASLCTGHMTKVWFCNRIITQPCVVWKVWKQSSSLLFWVYRCTQGWETWKDREMCAWNLLWFYFPFSFHCLLDLQKHQCDAQLLFHWTDAAPVSNGGLIYDRQLLLWTKRTRQKKKTVYPATSVVGFLMCTCKGRAFKHWVTHWARLQFVCWSNLICKQPNQCTKLHCSHNQSF